MRIGILDSSIGGLTVVREVATLLPGYDLLYYGDSARAPYGTKGPETVARCALEGARFLKSCGAGLLVIASHTISAIAADQIADQVGMPVLEAVTPAVQEALFRTRVFRIGVIGTPRLIATRIYDQKIKTLRADARVASSSCPLLVPLIESGWLTKPETAMIVKKCLHPIKARQVDALILGCAYYPALSKMIQKKIGKRVQVVSASAAQARALKNFLSLHPDLDRRLSRTGKHQFMLSDLAGQNPRVANTLFGHRVTLEQAPQA